MQQNRPVTTPGADLPRARRYGFPLLAYAFAAIMLGTTLPTPMYALYADKMHFAVFTTTVIFAIYAIGVLGALLVFGRWSDAIGRRPVLLAGAVLALVSAVVFLLAEDITVLLIGRVLSGLSAGIFTGTATAAVIEAVPPQRRDQAAAVATIANIGGLGAGTLLAGLLVQYAPHPLYLSYIVHIVLVVLAIPAVLLAPETSDRSASLGFQRLSVPPEVRPIFVIAAIAAFAGFAVMGLYTATAPSFVSSVMGISSHAVAGAVASSIFFASAISQLVAGRLSPERAVAIGCAIMVLAMVILALGLQFSSITSLIAAAVVAGVGQGISFSRGLAAILEQTPADRRAEVSSTYFVVAYVALSIPVVGLGFTAQHLGLRTAGVSFAVAVAILSAVCFWAILAQESKRRRASASST